MAVSFYICYLLHDKMIRYYRPVMKVRERIPFFNLRYGRGVPFLSINGMQKGKGLNLGAEPPYRTL